VGRVILRRSQAHALTTQLKDYPLLVFYVANLLAKCDIRYPSEQSSYFLCVKLTVFMSSSVCTVH